MKILGISTSRRKWGNTDLIVAQVLKGAKAEGAEVRLIRPADLDLAPCNGCMRCVFQSRDCVIPDRFGELYQVLRWADSVVFGAPTYVLAPNSVQKNVQDRLIELGKSHEMRGKSAVALVTAGVPAWEGLSLALTAQQAHFLGMTLVDRFVAHAQGPGEVLENESAMSRAHQAGRALGRGETAYLGEPGLCPLCTLDVVKPEGKGRGRCMICDVGGALDGGAFTPDANAKPRYAKEMIDHHFNERVLPSGPKFKENVRHYLGLIADFKKDFEGEPIK